METITREMLDNQFDVVDAAQDAVEGVEGSIVDLEIELRELKRKLLVVEQARDRENYKYLAMKEISDLEAVTT